MGADRCPGSRIRPRPPWALWAALLILGAAATARAQPSDPNLTWRTIDTPHFTIHYYVPLGMLARRLAVVAERANSAVADVMGYQGGRRTHIVLTDETDDANGSATALPYNVIRLYATAPDALSPLGDYDDWLNILVTHEHTHIVHLDQWGGVASIINMILGKVYAPNMVQPRWVLEGIAVWQESERTAGGRLRSTMFDMYLRMDALEDRFFDIDQMSNIADRWPHGNVWYLYGSQFIEYIANRFGREAIATIARAYGDSVIPWGLNRVARRATGHGFVELYQDFLTEKRRHYEAQRDHVIAGGRVEGERITFHGEVARLPRFTRDGRVTYWRADARSRTRVMAFDLEHPDAQRTWARAWGDPGYAIDADARAVYFTRPDNLRDIYIFHDLFRRDLESGHIARLTTGLRAREPDLSPDGRRIAFTINQAGTTHLVVADTDDIQGTARRLVISPRYDQVYNPRFSPDGRTIAFSRWQRGGYRDIALVEVESGRVIPLTHDRALDTGPTWSADGRKVYFSSDRSGIANIYAYHLSSGLLRQVTNVVSGAYQPAVSPDGDHLVYVGYTSWGFDLFHLDLRGVHERPAPPYVDTRPPPTVDDAIWNGPSRDYQPLETLWPRSWLADLTNDGFGPAIGVTVSGRDLAGWHRWAVRATTGLSRGTMNADLDYEYRRMPLVIGAHVYHHITPRRGFLVGGQEQGWIQRSIGGQLRLSYTIPRTFASQQFAVSWNPRLTEAAEPLVAPLDPNQAPPVYPINGFHSEVRASYRFSTLERYTYDISPSNGTALALTGGLQDPIFGSQFRSVALTWDLRQYLPMPWLRHHVLALHYAGGISGGQVGQRTVFSVGGFPNANIIDGLINGAVLGGAALRGYPAYSRSGTQYHLVQAEYRFPVWRVNHGILTLPVYVNRIHAAAFVDAGNAFNGSPDFSAIRVGVGAQVMIDFTLGYVLPFTLRIGYARGLMAGGIDQVYGHLGVGF